MSETSAVPVTSHHSSLESTSPVAATDGARTEDIEAVAVEIKERLFIDVSRGLPAEGGLMPLWSSLYHESPREQVYPSQQSITPATLLRLRLGGPFTSPGLCKSHWRLQGHYSAEQFCGQP